MYIVTPDQMKSIDHNTISRIGIPGLILMENASRSIYNIMQENLEDELSQLGISIFCGKGNNGGDGFALARYLHNAGADVTVFSFVDSNTVKGDAKVNFDICARLGIEIIFLVEDSSDLDAVADMVAESELTVDAIFGTGFKGPVGGFYSEVINLINEHSQFILSIDIPSGLDGLTGTFSETVFADMTVTLGYVKTGLLICDGPSVCGRIFIGDLGIPESVLNHEELNYRSIDDLEASHMLPARFADSHKGSYGKVAVLAGSRLMTGAARYVVKGLDCMGTGLIHFVSDQDTEELGRLLFETVKILPDCFSVEKPLGFDCMVIGPGLGTAIRKKELMHQAIKCSKNQNIPLLLDADAINILSEMDLEELDIFFSDFETPPLLTPHPGEFSRLIKVDRCEISGRELDLVKAFSQRWNCVILLKGVTSIITHPSGEVVFNTSGNDALAKGGSGDVLAGIAGNILAQTKDPFISAVLGSYILGRTAELYTEKHPSRTCNPEKLIDMIPEMIEVLEKLRSG